MANPHQPGDHRLPADARQSRITWRAWRRFGINPQNTLGISIPALRQTRQAGRQGSRTWRWSCGPRASTRRASWLPWSTSHAQVTPEQMEAWAADFDSWDVCDQVCANLFDRTPHAPAKALEWSERPEEFVKRAGFALMACLAWHDKKARRRPLRELPARHRPRSHRRAQLRQKSRQLGAAPDRQA